MADDPHDEDIQLMAGLIIGRMLETIAAIRQQGTRLGLLEFELAGCRVLATFDDLTEPEDAEDDAPPPTEQVT